MGIRLRNNVIWYVLNHFAHLYANFVPPFACILLIPKEPGKK